MKNFREKAVLGLKIAAVMLLALYCLTETGEVKTAVSEAIDRCIYIIIPSLYAMMIVSGILVSSGITDAAPGLLGRIGKVFFGMNGQETVIFIFSMLAGYPVGAKMLCSDISGDPVRKRRAELLSGVCFGAGPAFIFGCISGQLYGSPAAGRIVVISTISANVILAVILSYFLRRIPPRPSARKKIQLTGSMVTGCTIDAGRSIAGICFMITAFSVIAAALGSIGVISAAGKTLSRFSGLSVSDSGQLFCAFLDVTAVGGLTHGNYRLLPWICALVSFGGVCVMFQIAAVTSGKLSLKPLVLMRMAAAAVSFGVCKAIMPFMLRNETVEAASVNVHTHQAASPVPSVMLIIMTVMLFVEYGKIKPSH